MRVDHRHMMLGGLVLVIGVLALPGQSQATAPSGVVGSPLVRGSFTDDVGVKFKLSLGGRTIVSKAKDASQVAFQNFTFSPAGHTGWHSHPGPVVVLVKSGALTYYQGSGPCVGRVYPAGSAFVDSGSGRAHLARNESGVPVETSVVYFGVPAGASPRIDEPAPGNCKF
jgi:quercetin dioxygenase-like cupin family protein